MRIAHVTTVHQSDDVRIYRKEVLSLKQAGFDVCVIGPVLENGKTLEVPHISIPHFRNRLLRMTLGPILALIETFKHKIKVVHFHDPELIFIATLLKLFRIRIIYDVHEDYPKQIKTKRYLPKNFRLFLSKFVELAEKSVSRKFDLIINVVPAINDKFIQLGCKTTIIKNFPLKEDFASLYPIKSEDLRGPSTSKKFVIYVGGISEDRGLFQMIKASRYTKIPVLLVGPIHDKKSREYLTKNESENWQYSPKIPHKEVIRLLNDALCGLVVLQPTERYLEALPVKMFEYMAAGLPVIASNFPMWREIIETEQCGMCVDPTNPEEIAQAINFYVDHPEIARLHGANGRRAVLEKYNWEKEAEKLIEAYNQLLKK